MQASACLLGPKSTHRRKTLEVWGVLSNLAVD
jgi:hypothetical protein